MLHGHGDNGYLHGREIIADFSTNVWYGGEPAGLKEHLFGQWKRINKYPEVLAESLAKKVALHHGLEPENILITNGATESIYLTAQAYKNKNTGIVIPSFAEYEDACRMHEHRIRFLHWDDLQNSLNRGHLEIATSDGSQAAGNDALRATGLDALQAMDLVWLGSPNNPTGEIFQGLETLIRDNPRTLFIVDEAFIDFTVSAPSVITLIPRVQNLIVLRSLTKAFAIPGLRLGYTVAHRDLVKKLQAFKLPWSVNAMALEAGNFIFNHYVEISIPLTQLLKDRADFVRQLQQIGAGVGAGITTHASDTHFFLCETTQGTAAELQGYLLETSRLWIRDASNFRGLGKGHFRLCTLTPGQNQLLVNALKEWQKQYT